MSKSKLFVAMFVMIYDEPTDIEKAEEDLAKKLADSKDPGYFIYGLEKAEKVVYFEKDGRPMVIRVNSGEANPNV